MGRVISVESAVILLEQLPSSYIQVENCKVKLAHQHDRSPMMDFHPLALPGLPLHLRSTQRQVKI